MLRDVSQQVLQWMLKPIARSFELCKLNVFGKALGDEVEQRDSDCQHYQSANGGNSLAQRKLFYGIRYGRFSSELSATADKPWL